MTSTLPAPFDDEFLADLPYDPRVFFLDRLLAVDREASVVRCRMPTDRPLPLTDDQRAHDVHHPRHVAGGLMVHVTGMMGFVHAYYVLGLRHREGWIGYGTHIHDAVFRKLVVPGSPLEVSCRTVRQRLGRERHMIRYAFAFEHEGKLAYQSEQTAVWMRTDKAPA